jgi:hypothetical protein
MERWKIISGTQDGCCETGCLMSKYKIYGESSREPSRTRTLYKEIQEQRKEVYRPKNANKANQEKLYIPNNLLHSYSTTYL